MRNKPPSFLISRIFVGANIAQQYLKLGLIDEISIGITPILLGNGKRLFDNIGKHIELTLIKTKQYEEDSSGT